MGPSTHRERASECGDASACLKRIPVTRRDPASL